MLKILKNTIGVAIVFYISVLAAFAQLPNNHCLRASNGMFINFEDTIALDQPTVLIFWKLSDPKSCQNLEETALALENSFGCSAVNIVAICEGGSVSHHQAQAWIACQDLKIINLYDPNEELSRQMGINVPFTMILNQDKQIIYKQAGYMSGNEEIVSSIVKTCLVLQ